MSNYQTALEAAGAKVMKMETVYKLTDAKMRTRPDQSNETLWGENITHTAPGTEEMCGPGWIHAYTHPLLALLLNRAHADFDSNTMLLWECRAIVGIRRADKIGCMSLTTIKQISLPIITISQRQAFAILIAKQIYKEKSFQKWADAWLSGKDRSANAALAAYAADAAANAAANAANAAAYAAANAAYAAYAAANAAANAAYANLDLVVIAEKAMKY